MRNDATRRAILSLVLLCYAVVASRGQNTVRSVMFKPQFASADMALGKPVHIDAYRYAEWSLSGDGSITKSKAYKRAVKNRNTGIGLLAGGTASLVLGSILMADGITHLRQDNWNATGSSLQHAQRFYETYFGAVFGVAGLSMVIPGFIVLDRGSTKMRQIKSKRME
jgi:hypothetical protein